MFYNTGIPTYIFVITNRKEKQRKGKTQLINTTSEHFYSKMRKSLGKKRLEFLPEHIAIVDKLYTDFEENEYSKIFANKEFGYAQITVHRPERDEQNKVILDKKGNPKSNSSLKDYENIPLKEDIQTFFEREVVPFAPDAYWNEDETKIGYEINFNKYFHQYTPPRTLKEIAADLFLVEEETENLLNEIVNG